MAVLYPTRSLQQNGGKINQPKKDLVVRRQMQLMCDNPFIVRSVHRRDPEAETIQH